MKSAFELLAVEAGRLDVAIHDRTGAVPVAHGDIAFLGQRVARQIVLMEIKVHLRVRPIENRIGLGGFFLLLDERRFDAGAGLRAAELAERIRRRRFRGARGSSARPW